MFLLYAATAAIVTLIPTLLRPQTALRHAAPVARELAFRAKAEVSSPTFSLGNKEIGSFFAEESALRVLMSQADSSERLDV